MMKSLIQKVTLKMKLSKSIRFEPSIIGILAILLMTVFASTQNCDASNVYVTNSASQAKYIVYVCKNRADAKKVIRVVNNASQAKQSDWWYITKDRSHADFAIYYTTDRSQANMIVYLQY
jgi:hypothetical protein